jgi:hypothetical protein
MLLKNLKRIKPAKTMDRRTALKNLTMSIGYTVAAPTIISVLASCSSESNTWAPLFLSEEEKHIVTHLVDVILPSDMKTPGALDVNIPQFIDKMYYDIELEEKKTLFKKGASYFAEKFKTSSRKDISDGKKEDFEKLVSTYFNLSDEDSKTISNQQRESIDTISSENIETYSLYKFLLSVRYYTIFGYCTSEKVGEEVLAYDPIPGAYNGCISLKETTNGRAWSL